MVPEWTLGRAEEVLYRAVAFSRCWRQRQKYTRAAALGQTLATSRRTRGCLKELTHGEFEAAAVAIAFAVIIQGEAVGKAQVTHG